MRNRQQGRSGANAGFGRNNAGRSVASGPGGNCICPQCGYTESHMTGLPCAQKKCPSCGIAMTRQMNNQEVQ